MDTFPDLGSLTDQELKELIKQLTDEEMEISYRRRILHGKIDILRAELVNLIEERVWELDRMPTCQPGLDLHFVGSRLVAYDTGERLPTPAALFEALPRLSLRSFFYHVHNARRRSGGRTDDFSNWLECYGADAALVAFGADRRRRGVGRTGLGRRVKRTEST